MIPAARVAHRRRQTVRARATLARVKPRKPPSRILPCPVCREEVGTFTMAAAYTSRGGDAVVPAREGTGLPDLTMRRAARHDQFTLQPCGHTFERREHPDWVTTFASEGE